MSTLYLTHVLIALAGAGVETPDACREPAADRSLDPPHPRNAPGPRHFGLLLMNPGRAEYRAYRGLEYPLAPGTPVRAAADGRVFYARVNGALRSDGLEGRGYGRLIKLRHGCGVSSRYAHLGKFLVREGQRVRQGQVIALSGNSGGSHQPHLHFEVLVRGRPVDPELAFEVRVGDAARHFRPPSKDPPLLAPLIDTAPGRRGFGRRRHPLTQRYADHQGQDYSAPVGTPVRAAADGVVYYARVSGRLATKTQPGRGYGRLVKIRHAHGVSTRYAHLRRFRVRRGQTVKRGQILGYVGNTGGSTGPHLHFEVRVEGRALDPLRALGRSLSALGAAFEEPSSPSAAAASTPAKPERTARRLHFGARATPAERIASLSF